MIKRAVLFLMSMMFFCSCFAESDWTALGSDDETVFGADRNSIAKINQYPYTNYKKIWTKSVIYNDLTKDGLTVGDYTLLLFWVDCSNQTIGTKAITQYKSNGKVFGESYNTSNVSMSDVVPNSRGAAILDLVCD